MFVNDRDKMSNPYREPSIDASYQVSVHLAKRFQRRRFLEIDQLETRIACDQNKMSTAKDMGPFRDLWVPSGHRTDVPAEPPSHRP